MIIAWGLLQVISNQFSSVQLLSHVQLFVTSWTEARQASCPSQTPRACSNSCPLSWWCHPVISSFVVPFSSCPQSFPASGSFPMSQLFASGGQSIGVSASASVLPMQIQDWFPLGLPSLIALQSKGCSSLLQHHSSKASIFQHSTCFIVQLSYPYMTTGKTIALTRWTFVNKVMPLLFNMLSMFVIAFLPRCKSLNFMAAVTISSDFGAQKNKVCHCFRYFPSICHEVMGLDAMILVFWMLSFKPTFSLFSFTFIKRLFSSSLLSAIRVVSSAYLRLLIFLLAFLISACVSSSLAFPMIYSAYKLNKLGDNVQPWHTTFPIWNQSVIPYLVLTAVSWPAYRFLRRQVWWSGIPISWRIFHSFSWPTQPRALV